MKVIIITGTPGTGKTALARYLAAKLGFAYIDPVRMFKREVSEGYDNIRRTSIVDQLKLRRSMAKLVRQSKNVKGLVIDSHMSHFLPGKYVSLCIVTRCSLKILKKRLELKGYNASKVRENIDAEIFEVCLQEALEMGHKPLVLETSRASPKILSVAVFKALKRSARI